MRHAVFASVLAAAAASGTVQAAPAAAFDIVCQVTSTSQEVDTADKPVGAPRTRQSELRYSLDPARDRWCVSTNCAKGESTAFGRKDGDMLVFRQYDGADAGAFARYTRSTRRFELVMDFKGGRAGTELRISGACREEAFTGPAASTGGAGQ